MKIGLALSGGGVLGVAHLGVIEQLEKNNVKIDYICGSSIGAVVGLVYSSGGLNALTKFIDEVRRIKFYKNKKLLFIPNPDGYFEQVRKILQKYVSAKNFSDLKIKFSCVATNIQSAQMEVLQEGDPVDCVMASAAYPGVFSIQEVAGKYLIDGGVTRNLPADIVRKECDFVIGSSIYEVDHLGKKEVESMNRVRILLRTLDIFEKELAQLMHDECDYVFEPNVGHISWYSLSRIEEIREIGRDCAKKNIEELMKKLRGATSR